MKKKAILMSRGRPKKPGGGAVWIPGNVRSLVDAIVKGDRTQAAVLFAEWCAGENKLSESLDTLNKPNVN